jgi:hypothetical protein
VVRTRFDRRRVVLQIGDGGTVAAQAGDHSGEDHDEAIGARVDDSGVTQDLELLGCPVDGRLAVPHGALEQFGEQGILLAGGGVGREADLVHVRQAPRDRVRHLAENRQHRSLRRLAH